jgi:hypothetical protein
MTSEIIALRDQLVVSIRPIINAQSACYSEEEKFQNTTLRPIIKLQSPFLFLLMNDFLKMKHKNFKSLNVNFQHSLIRSAMKTELKLKNDMVNAVISLFTASELEFYKQHTSDTNKRIVQIITNRIIDQIEELY